VSDATLRLLDLLPEYEVYLRGKGHRPRGREKYIWDLKAVFRWLGDEATIADLTEDRIMAYRDARAAQVKAATVFNELTCTRSFCKWCVRKRWLSSDPTQHVDYPKVPRPSPRALTVPQIRLLFQIIDTEPATYKASWRRNRIVILLLFYTGLRISEASGLLWRDVDLEAGSLVVRTETGKNGRTRAIPLHPRLKLELEKLPNQQPDAPVIPRQSGKDDTGPMGPKSVAHIFERWLSKRGLNISPHQLRHTMATQMLRAGAELPDIQAVLGHESLETTAVYLTVEAEHLRGAVNMLPAGW
jgi:integrase/recombinase XerD